jgi:predicted dehydrogenase
MKLVIIGFGGMGSWHYGLMQSYNKSAVGEQIDVIGVYDIDEARNNFAREKGLKVYSNPTEIWCDKNVDAVLIATPNDAHCQYVIDAVNAGKHVICENQ